MAAKKYVVKKGIAYYPTDAAKKEFVANNPSIYRRANQDPIKFWAEAALKGLTWEQPFEKAYEEKLPYFTWFKGGKLNFSVNCIDRNLNQPNNTALIWVPEPTEEKPQKITYGELYDKVNKFANVLKANGIKKGDVVSIYMPMLPHTIIAMLACARIGAIHSVVFSAFSADALKARIEDGKAKILITSDSYYRKGRLEPLLKKAKQAAKNTTIQKIIVVNRSKKKKTTKSRFSKKFLDFDQELDAANSYCKPETMNAEDPLFILYTSGTTGKPKGVVHDTAGYAIHSYLTCKWNFNLKPNEVMWCTADVGWITGHTYAFYGPLMTGATSLIYEGGPDFPNYGRWWKIIQDHKVNVLYTAPTAIRMFMKLPQKFITKYNLDSLKILGTVGEPIDKESWLWYFKTVGGSRCPIVDTWFQTESSANLINSMPGIGPFIPAVTGKSFPGITHEIVDAKGKAVPTGSQGFLVQKSPFAPGMLHGVWNNEKKYKDTYWKNFKGSYDTSDGAHIEHGMIRITGRTDDVMKVAGHRLSTGELEDAIHDNANVGDVAVVPMPDKIKGEVPIAFIVLKKGTGSEVLEAELKKHTDKKIGPTARPKKIYFVEDLPKTRSGKIMRRILKALLVNEEPKGLMTLINPDSVDKIRKVIRESN